MAWKNTNPIMIEEGAKEWTSDMFTHFLYSQFKDEYAVLMKLSYSEDSGLRPDTYIRELEQGEWNERGWGTPRDYMKGGKEADGRGKLLLFDTDEAVRGITAELEVDRVVKTTGSYPYRNMISEGSFTDRVRVESLIVSIAEEIIAERGEPTPYTFIQNSIDPILYEELKKYGLVLDYTPDTVEKTLKKYIGTKFKVVDVASIASGENNTEQQRLLERRWWFVDPSKHRLDIPLNKRVEESIVNLLRKGVTVTFTEVLTEVYTRFQNSLTPDEQSIIEILKENATTYADGKWKIKSFVGAISAMHEKMCYYLAELGLKSGYEVAIASDECWKIYNGKRLDQLLKLTPLIIEDSWTKERVSKIDVIWHKSSDIFAEFEVEHSTQIVDAIIRGTNIKSTNVLRVIAIPSERESLVSRKFKEPGIKTIMNDANWSILTYINIESVYNEYIGKSKIDPNELLKFLRKPTDGGKDLKQKNLSTF